MIVPLPIYLFILIEVIFVTYLDIKYRKIKNIWSLLNMIVALSLFSLFPEMYLLTVASFQYSLVFIIVGFLLFQLKIMGGGDSKYLASFFLIIPSAIQDQVFFYLLISTIIIGALFFIKNIVTHWSTIVDSFRTHNLAGVKSCFGTKFAYAPVILIAWLFTGIKYLI